MKHKFFFLLSDFALTLVCLFAFSVSASAQNARYPIPWSSISSSTSIPFLVAAVPPNSPILAVCNFPAVVNASGACTNYATTYTSAGVACSNGAQDTPDPQPSACQATGDAQGNMGFWAPPGKYTYTVCIQNTTSCFGPYSVTLSGGPVYGNYTFSVSNGIVAATSNTPGHPSFSGTDAAVVINSALNSLASVGGKLFFKAGIYPINSLTAETASTWTSYYYGIGIPANSISGWVQFQFEGEFRPPWTVDSSNQPYITQSGVIFDVSPSAVAGVSASNTIVGLWQRPSGSVALGPSFFSNEDFFRNLEVRLPANTRGNEIGIGMYSAMTVDLENVAATFNMTAAALAAALPTAGSSGSYGIASSYGSSGNVQHFKNVYTAGFQYGYDIEGEHFVGDTVTSVYSTYAGIIARTGGPVYHPIVMTHVVDQENQNGWVLGPNIQPGQRIDMIGLDIETIAGVFARVNNLYETNPGYSNGLITYASVLANVGEVAIAPFAHGGNNFIVANGNGIGTDGLAFGSHPFASYSPCTSVGFIPTEGRYAVISDSTTATWGAIITGGGSNHVLGYCDGTNWTVSAK